MKALMTAIMTLFNAAPGGVNNDFYNDVQGRLYNTAAPDGANEFPYAIFFIVSDIPEYPGGKTIEEVMIQFSLFSSDPSPVEIDDMLTDLQTLFDDCALTVTGYSQIYFIRGNLTTMRDDITTPDGMAGVWHYAQEYMAQIVK